MIKSLEGEEAHSPVALEPISFVLSLPVDRNYLTVYNNINKFSTCTELL